MTVLLYKFTKILLKNLPTSRSTRAHIDGCIIKSKKLPHKCVFGVADLQFLYHNCSATRCFKNSQITSSREVLYLFFGRYYFSALAYIHCTLSLCWETLSFHFYMIIYKFSNRFFVICTLIFMKKFQTWPLPLADDNVCFSDTIVNSQAKIRNLD